MQHSRRPAMASKRKVTVRAWNNGSFYLVQIGRKAWQRIVCQTGFAADVFGTDWQATEIDAQPGKTFAKRRDKWIKATGAKRLSPHEAKRLDAERREGK